MNKNSLAQIRKDESVDDMQDSTLKDYLKNKNDNIVIFEEEINKDNARQKYNRTLSAITSIYFITLNLLHALYFLKDYHFYIFQLLFLPSHIPNKKLVYTQFYSI